MSLKHYYINAQKLSLEERIILFDKVENLAFMRTFDLNNPGCVEVFWSLKDDIKKVISFPSQCIITIICESE